VHGCLGVRWLVGEWRGWGVYLLKLEVFGVGRVIVLVVEVCCELEVQVECWSII
jgi:hypothetical protein